MDRTCSAPECARPHSSKGYCRWHYERLRRGQSLNPEAKSPRTNLCQIDGCTALARSLASEWCEMHYHRWYRNGGPTILQPRPEYWTHSQGYRIVSRPGHVLANASGAVYQHRLVLFEKIGPGAHSCHWCGTVVSWDFTYPQRPDALVVDHIDDVKSNNDPSNLVPSCNPCNGGRAATARHAATRHHNSSRGNRG